MNKVQKSIVLVFTIAIASILLFTTIENNVFAIEYTNEKCGVSIQYPEDWQVENDDYKSEGLRSFVTISPDSDDVLDDFSIRIWDISDYREKTIEYVSEIFTPESTEGIINNVIQNNIIEVGGFPAQKLAYSEEFEGYITYSMEINILAYDKIYQIYLAADDQDKFDKYLPLVDQIATNIKITKPNFEGINC